MVLVIRIRKLYFDSACIRSFLPNIKTDTSILKQENSMQHKNIHIIKHAKQIKTNTAYRCRPGPGGNASQDTFLIREMSQFGSPLKGTVII